VSQPSSATPGGYCSTLTFGDHVPAVVVGVAVVAGAVVAVGVSLRSVMLEGVVPPLQPAVTRRRAAQTASAARRFGDVMD